MRRVLLPLLLLPALLDGCSHAEKARPATIAELRNVEPDLQEAKVEKSLDQALQGYRRFLEETPETEMTPEAMRRLADLKLEKQFGIRGGDGKPKEMAAPQPSKAPATPPEASPDTIEVVSGPILMESDEDFEQRTTAANSTAWDTDGGASQAGTFRPGGDPNAALEAIALYDKLLTEYPSYEHNDQVLYQKARAYDELGRTDEAIATMERLIASNPHSEHFDEVQFRRGEYFFTRRRYRDAEGAYSAIIGLGTRSTYYELALYKLGWTLYKQDLYDEALQKYMALLDYKVSNGYDFDEAHAEDDERRIADTFRVISLGFSNLGGADAVKAFFTSSGSRPYEDRVYGNLGEHYLAKLRYDDAAKTYKAFVALNPFHKAAPRFGMRLVETYTKGGFPKLVLEAKRDFAATYGLKADYWKHFKPEESPEVVGYLKTNLKDLANHYHAQYKAAQDPGEKTADYREAQRWYGDYLDSFPADPESPAINYQLADLLLENKDFGEAARQYERTAYTYPAHAQSAAAGYAAVYAYREQLKAASDDQKDAVKRDTIASSIKFADAFPQHEHAADILGAAADDLYEMKSYPEAVASAQRLIDTYPGAEADLRRSAWEVVAHGSFELADYPRAEVAYSQVLAATPEGDASRPALVDNLAASIYKQGEAAKEAQDYRAAADHFLRIRTAAPTSTIRASAEFDAGAALILLKDWTAAAGVLEAFRSAYPDHEMQREATKQIALAYRESGQLGRAAGEYDRLASQSDDPAVRGEALLVAGDLYAQSNDTAKALDAYTRYVKEFPQPVEAALETRSKIAEIHKGAHDQALYEQELRDIVQVDAEAGSQRTARTRTIAARSALVLAEQTFAAFTTVKLVQPFETSLTEKKQRMDASIEALDHLVGYEIAEVTAAATFYMAETYLDFSRSLETSERPADLEPADLEEYEKQIKETASPFAEKAVGLHEKNLEMFQAGVVNAWTEKSFAKLSELMPERYAKNEVSSDFLAELDVYVYRAPATQIYGPAMSDAATSPAIEPVQAVNQAPDSGQQR